MALGATGRLSLLRRNRGFALLFWATAGSAVGTYLAALALSVDILDRTDSGRWLAALLIADFLPLVLIGLTLGPLVDRLSRRRLMTEPQRPARSSRQPMTLTTMTTSLWTVNRQRLEKAHGLAQDFLNATPCRKSGTPALRRR